MDRHKENKKSIKSPHSFTKWTELLSELKWFERDERRIRTRKKGKKFLYYAYPKKKKKKLVLTDNLAVRKSLENRLWREAVFSRDDYTCQKCTQRGGTLHSHHIFNFSTYLDLRFAIDNGITLCKKCHRAFHHKYGTRKNTWEQLSEFLELKNRPK